MKWILMKWFLMNWMIASRFVKIWNQETRNTQNEFLKLYKRFDFDVLISIQSHNIPCISRIDYLFAFYLIIVSVKSNFIFLSNMMLRVLFIKKYFELFIALAHVCFKFCLKHFMLIWLMFEIISPNRETKLCFICCLSVSLSMYSIKLSRFACSPCDFVISF